MSKEAAELARKAVDVLRSKGHHKGKLQDERTGAVCLWGAVFEAADVDVASSNADKFDRAYDRDPIRELRKFFRVLFEGSFTDKILHTTWPGAEYNDLQETTQEDVEKVLLQAADKLDVA